MFDQMHLSLHKTSTTKEREGYFLKPYYTFYTLTIQSENKERWRISTVSIRVCTKRTWTQGRLGVRGGDQLWQGVKWDPSHHSSTIKCRPGVRLVSRAASRLTWATNKANDPSSPTILTWPTLVPPVVWERGPCEPSVFVLWLVDSACWSGGTFFSSLERCLVSGAKGAIVKPRDQAQRWQWD